MHQIWFANQKKRLLDDLPGFGVVATSSSDPEIIESSSGLNDYLRCEGETTYLTFSQVHGQTFGLWKRGGLIDQSGRPGARVAQCVWPIPEEVEMELLVRQYPAGLWSGSPETVQRREGLGQLTRQDLADSATPKTPHTSNSQVIAAVAEALASLARGDSHVVLRVKDGFERVVAEALYAVLPRSTGHTLSLSTFPDDRERCRVVLSATSDFPEPSGAGDPYGAYVRSGLHEYSQFGREGFEEWLGAEHATRSLDEFCRDIPNFLEIAGEVLPSGARVTERITEGKLSADAIEPSDLARFLRTGDAVPPLGWLQQHQQHWGPHAAVTDGFRSLWKRQASQGRFEHAGAAIELLGKEEAYESVREIPLNKRLDVATALGRPEQDVLDSASTKELLGGIDRESSHYITVVKLMCSRAFDKQEPAAEAFLKEEVSRGKLTEPPLLDFVYDHDDFAKYIYEASSFGNERLAHPRVATLHLISAQDHEFLEAWKQVVYPNLLQADRALVDAKGLTKFVKQRTSLSPKEKPSSKETPPKRVREPQPNRAAGGNPNERRESQEVETPRMSQTIVGILAVVLLCVLIAVGLLIEGVV